VEHPQTNGQAKSANKVILTELKKRLGSVKRKWVEELPEVLWAYKCTPHSATGETPYNLTYGTDAMLPVEVGEPTIRRKLDNLKLNEECLKTELDLLQKMRDKAKVREEACKQRAARRYNSKTKSRSFQEGDLVWRMREEARKPAAEGKFNSNWEGPFKVKENLSNEAYRLQHLDGREVSRTWNASHLKMYFSLYVMNDVLFPTLSLFSHKKGFGRSRF